jgi:hypothetical protein
MDKEIDLRFDGMWVGVSGELFIDRKWKNAVAEGRKKSSVATSPVEKPCRQTTTEPDNNCRRGEKIPRMQYRNFL